MDSEILDEEWSIMYEESARMKILDSSTFQKPIKNIRVRKPLILRIGRSVKDAIDLMRQKQIGCVLIEREHRLVGILTERDIIEKVVASGRQAAEIPVEEIMTSDPESFEAEDSIAYVLNAMSIGGYRHLPVIDKQGQPIAVISVKDIIGFIVEHFPEELLNLPPSPVRKSASREGA